MVNHVRQLDHYYMYQAGMCPEHFQLDQIQNNLNMPDIWQSMPDS